MNKRILWMMVLVLALPVMGTAAAPPKGQVRVLSNVSGGKTDEENKLFEAAVRKATGLEVFWEKVPASYDQVLMQKLGAGEAYDLIYITQFQMYNLARQGAILDLTDRIAKSAIYKENVPPAELEKYDTTVNTMRVQQTGGILSTQRKQGNHGQGRCGFVQA